MNPQLAQFEDYASAHAGDPAWLRDLRHSGWEAFAAQGLPTSDMEEWKYTSLRSLTEFPLRASAPHDEPPARELSTYWESDPIRFVFINGQLHSLISSSKKIPGATLSRWNESLAANDVLSEILRVGNGIHNDAFCALNQAFLGDAALLHITSDFPADAFIHILHLNQHAGRSLISPRLVVLIDPHAQATIIESFITQDESENWVNSLTDIRVGAHARLSHAIAQKNGTLATQVCNTRVTQKKSSTYNAFTLTLGGRLVRNNLVVIQQEESSTTELNGLYMVRGERHIDNHTIIDHTKPDGRSRQLYKGILEGRGRAVFNGRIHVRPGAAGTDSAQLNRNLLLSPDARVDTKPELLIDASDVKCKHGATVGQLSDEEIFYFQSRAISRNSAERMLVRGFAEDAIGLVPNAVARQKLEWLLSSRVGIGGAA